MNTKVYLLLVGAICFLVGNNPQAVAQMDLDGVHVPDSAVVAVLAWPSEVLGQSGMELLPHEIITAWGEQEFGMDPMKIEMLLALVDQPDLQAQPGWGCLVRFSDTMIPGGNLIQPRSQQSFEGLTSYQIAPGMRMVAVDRSNYLVGEDTFLKKMLTPSRNAAGTLAKLLNGELDKGSLHAWVDIAAVRPLLNGMLDLESIPEPLRGFAEIPNLVNRAYLRQELNSEFAAQLVMTSEPGQAAKLADLLNGGLRAGKQMLLAELTANLDMNDPIQKATMKYAYRLTDHLEQQLRPEIDGDDLVFTAGYGVSSLPILTALLLPAVQQAREAARRVDSANRMTPIDAGHAQLPCCLQLLSGQYLR